MSIKSRIAISHLSDIFAQQAVGVNDSVGIDSLRTPELDLSCHPAG
jgi:hypothetical protein